MNLVDPNAALSLINGLPRLSHDTPLPPLSAVIPDFPGLAADRSKLSQIAAALRPVIAQYRGTRNLTFYPTRDLARFFRTSHGTAIQAVARLETEGLVRRVRGSRTLLMGAKTITRVPIRAVVGLPLWHFAQRFSPSHNSLARDLGRLLWPHQVVVDTIPHFDLGDNTPDLHVVLETHKLDFVVWHLPFAHHLDCILRLRDRGVRTLITGLDTGSPGGIVPHVIIDITAAYRQLLHYWKKQQGLKRILVIEPREFPQRTRIRVFSDLARQHGFECEIMPSAYALPRALLAREKSPVGIALLDEYATAEFVFYDPPSFVKLARKHRILFGNGKVNMPFVPAGEITAERIFIHHDNSLEKAIIHVLMSWLDGDFSAAPIHANAWFDRDFEIPRYL